MRSPIMLLAYRPSSWPPARRKVRQAKRECMNVSYTRWATPFGTRSLPTPTPNLPYSRLCLPLLPKWHMRLWTRAPKMAL
ncbi:hypothetical protein FKM82_005336 [Ascaphus truei]